MKFQIVCLTMLCSCGYHAVDSDMKTTLSIPYVKGDEQGQLTSALIRQLNNSNLYEFVSSEGDLTLKVAIVDDSNDTIGFRYDRSEISGKIEQNLMETENRHTVIAEVTLLKSLTDEIMLGPVIVSASTDYDFIDVNSLRELAFITPSGRPEKVINFSLGQLDSVEGAQDASLQPVYQQLSQKIISTLDGI
jgi:hypothetical protein